MSDKGRGWFRESLREVVVVVLSILIAFGLDAWWDETLERRDERELLTNLVREFRDNESRLTVRLANHQQLAAAADELAGRLSSARGRRTAVPDSLLLSLLITPTFDPTLGTLEEAQSSGRTRLIRNAELRARLGAWTGLWRDAREEERLAWELVQDQMYPVIANTTDVSDLMELGGRWLTGQLPEDVGSAEREVSATPALVNYAKHRWVRSRRAVIELSELSEELRRIIELLEAEGAG